MAIHLLTSVSGGPGVTTTAIAWATLAANPALLVEADMTGGSAVLAGPYRGQVMPEHTILSLAEYQPHEIPEQLWWHTLPLPDTDDRRLLPTITTPAQARALTPAWPGIAHALRQLADQTGTDILIDYGRISTQHGGRPLLDVADTIIVLLPGTMAGVNTAKRTLDIMRSELALRSPRRIVAVPVIPTGAVRRWWRAGISARPWTAGEIAELLGPTEVLTHLEYDPDAAASYSAGTLPPRRVGAYRRSVLELAGAAHSHTQQLRALAGKEIP